MSYHFKRVNLERGDCLLLVNLVSAFDKVITIVRNPVAIFLEMR